MERKRGFLVAAAAVMFLATAATLSARASKTASSTPPRALPERVAMLRYDPQFIPQAVARRMGVALLPGMPVPAVLLESRAPLERLQAAAERQWGFRLHVFVTAYASAGNEIYLIDDATLYERDKGTPDDSLAHKLVHLLQANYRKDTFNTDWSESEAVAIQTWFRQEYIGLGLAATDAQPNTPVDRAAVAARSLMR